MSTNEHFDMNQFAIKHLFEWFDFGMAPSDWDVEDLRDFALWVKDNETDLPYNASWSELVEIFTKDRVQS